MLNWWLGNELPSCWTLCVQKSLFVTPNCGNHCTELCFAVTKSERTWRQFILQGPWSEVSIYLQSSATKDWFLLAQFFLVGKTLLKFIYSEMATKFCEIFPLILTTVHTVKSKWKISQNFVAFSECMNFICTLCIHSVEFVQLNLVDAESLSF